MVRFCRVGYIVLLIIICNSYNSNAQEKRLYNTKSFFSIVFPKTWKILKNYQGTTVVAEAPFEDDNDAYHENINILVEEIYEEDNLKSYSTMLLEDMRSYLEDLKFGKKGSFDIGTYSGKFFEYSYESEISGVRVKDIVYIVLKGGNAYVLTCSAEDRKYDMYFPDFEATAKTFRLDTIGYKKSMLASQTALKLNTAKPKKEIFNIPKTKAKDLVLNIPEVKSKSDELKAIGHSKIYLKVLIVKDPTKEDPIYEMEAGENNPFNFILNWRFSVDANTGKVTVFNPYDGSYMSIKEWRAQKKR